MLTLSDAHIHLSPFAEDFLAHHAVPSVISCATPEECAHAEALASQHAHIFCSYGIHPWHAAETSWEAILPWLEKATLIGEIGMDNVWCDTDLALQREVFERQVAFAAAHHKPVVLHTKGMEREIYEIIRRYPNTYHVHWYAADHHLDDYLALGCYMSVGPFPTLDENVAAVAMRTPRERLLIETDGIDAVRWACGEDVDDSRYPDVLRRIAGEIAALRGEDEAAILACTHDNLLTFVHSGDA